MNYIERDSKQLISHHSHITIHPYKLGEIPALEKHLSVWVDAEYKYNPLGYDYDEKTQTLYVPRGISSIMLERQCNTRMLTNHECVKPKRFNRVTMTCAPRDRIQTQSIDFLSGYGDKVDTLKFSQQALILDTGDGKTYTTTHAIINHRMTSIIITHQDAIKMQWIDTFKTKTTMPHDYLINLQGSDSILDVISGKKEGYIYFVNHQTLKSFAKQYGWEAVRKFFEIARIGIKVFDEAHLNFRNVLLIDFHSNVFKTFYLTANFGRTDTKEGILYKRVFSNVKQFGEETKNYAEKRKHIIYVPVLYRSTPSAYDKQYVLNNYGFSVLNFSNYALHEDPKRTQINKFLDILDIAMKMEGRILVTVPRIDDTEFIMKTIKDEYLDLTKTIGTINSRNTKVHNEDVKENCDIIVSTIKSCGTGVDIKKLRCVINMEPFSSHITSNQLAGRLREYSPTQDTYLFDLIDTAFPTCENQYRTKLTHMKKKCKEIQVYKK